MTMLDVALILPQPDNVLVMVYVPAVECSRSISPVLALTKMTPVPAENVPAIPPPVMVGVALPVWQNGEPWYANVATGIAVTETETVLFDEIDFGHA